MTAFSRSYAQGISTTPLLHQTIGETLDLAAERWPDREAVVVRDRNIRLTYLELRHQVDSLAAGFVALGLKPGERIGIWSPNRIEWILTLYAPAKAGLILVNINPAYRLAELEYALNKVHCRALVTADHFKTSLYVAMLRSLAPELNHCPPGALQSERLPHLTTVIHMEPADEPGFYRFDEITNLGGPAERKRLAELADLIQPDDRSTSSSHPARPARQKGRRSRTITSSITHASKPSSWGLARETAFAIRCRFTTPEEPYAAA